MSNEFPKPKPEAKKQGDEIPDEIDLGFASGIEEEPEAEVRNEVVWTREDLDELRHSEKELRSLELPFQVKAYRISSGTFISENFPDLNKEQIPEYLSELAETQEAIHSGEAPRSSHFTPDIMREYYRIALKISRKNQR